MQTVRGRNYAISAHSRLISGPRAPALVYIKTNHTGAVLDSGTLSEFAMAERVWDRHMSPRHCAEELHSSLDDVVAK